MASISKSRAGLMTVQFAGMDRQRKKIFLGRCTKRHAEQVRVRVERILAAGRDQVMIDAETAGWLRKIDNKLAEKLARVQLIPSRKKASLDQFVTEYIAGRGELKPKSRSNYDQARRYLVQFFGADHPIDRVTEADAAGWLTMMKAKLKPATVGRRLKYARQFFAAAVDRGRIANNPFAKLKCGQLPDENRKVFVERDVVQNIIDAAPDAEWRLIIALSRYGGIRTPSETLALQWNDVNWDSGKILIRSSKTEHHDGHGSRWIPLFPELRPYLEEAFEIAADGAVYAITKSRDSGVNWRTQLIRIIHQAGLTPWPKLFHNMRASRETELAKEWPLHIACAWIGNSARIAARHYLQVTEDDFQKAVQKTVQPAHATAGNGMPTTLEPSAIFARFLELSRHVALRSYARRDSNPQPSEPKSDALSS